MKTLTVELAERRYDIHLAENILAEPQAWLGELAAKGQALAVVSDENVWKYYGEIFSAGLSKAGLKFSRVIFPAGENNKSMDGLNTLYKAFAETGLRRDSLVIALGGGVIGDLSGFAAATWMRGISYIQVPTTLLAQVDSSIGGKTAINLPYGKNMVGVFYQPIKVVIDPESLKTLPPREFRCGLAEVIKYGAIRSASLFEKLERNGDDNWLEIIGECCSIKAEIVARDEFDHGERALLNFGHSFGHAIESFYQYQHFNHGEAVAVGMFIAAVLGEELGLTAPGTSERVKAVLSLHKLAYLPPCPPLDLLPYLGADKKSEGIGLRMIFLKKIGESFSHTISFDNIEKTLHKAADKWKQ